jgi:hypothetical protein
VSWPGVTLTIALLTFAGAGCSDDPRAPESTSESDETAVDTFATVVPFHGLSLRTQPSPEAEGILEAAPGTPLRVLEARPDWLRVAMWDGRAGWVPERETFELPLWVHYQEALGGIPPSDLRPAYPLADGRWAVEAPFPSGMMTDSRVWVDGEPASALGVAAILDVPSACGPRRLAILVDRPAPGTEAVVTPRRAGRMRAADEPRLDLARMAAPGAPSPRLYRLMPAPATPTPAQAQAVSTERVRVPSPNEVEWLAIGEGAFWVRSAATSGATALLVLDDGADTKVQVVVAPDAAPETTDVLLLHTFSTGAGARPSLFVVERSGSHGRWIEIYAARADDVRRLYTGYVWGC